MITIMDTREAVEKVFKELSEMPTEEFRKMLDEHKCGDIYYAFCPESDEKK